METSEPARRRPLLAVLGALFIALVVGGLALYQHRTQAQLATIAACRRCGAAGRAVEAGWVVVPPGDSWAVAMGDHAGLVARGPARFEVIGKERIALSAGVCFLAAGQSGRMVVLLPGGESPGAEGATAATAGTQARLTALAGAAGNGVLAVQGQASLQLHAGPRALSAGESWRSSAQVLLPAPDGEERAWLERLAGGP